MVRLYVGGLPPDVSAEQLAQRFAPFGRVEGADLALPQAAGAGAAPQPGCRGFGYVELEPQDDAALRRCLSTVRPWPAERTGSARASLPPLPAAGPRLH
jgi:hypothetical protein